MAVEKIGLVKQVNSNQTSFGNDTLPEKQPQTKPSDNNGAKFFAVATSIAAVVAAGIAISKGHKVKTLTEEGKKLVEEGKKLTEENSNLKQEIDKFMKKTGDNVASTVEDIKPEKGNIGTAEIQAKPAMPETQSQPVTAAKPEPAKAQEPQVITQAQPEAAPSPVIDPAVTKSEGVNLTHPKEKEPKEMGIIDSIKANISDRIAKRNKAKALKTSTAKPKANKSEPAVVTEDAADKAEKTGLLKKLKAKLSERKEKPVSEDSRRVSRLKSRLNALDGKKDEVDKFIFGIAAQTKTVNSELAEVNLQWANVRTRLNNVTTPEELNNIRGEISELWQKRVQLKNSSSKLMGQEDVYKNYRNSVETRINETTDRTNQAVKKEQAKKEALAAKQQMAEAKRQAKQDAVTARHITIANEKFSRDKQDLINQLDFITQKEAREQVVKQKAESALAENVRLSYGREGD